MKILGPFLPLLLLGVRVSIFLIVGFLLGFWCSYDYVFGAHCVSGPNRRNPSSELHGVFVVASSPAVKASVEKTVAPSVADRVSVYSTWKFPMSRAELIKRKLMTCRAIAVAIERLEADDALKERIRLPRPNFDPAPVLESVLSFEDSEKERCAVEGLPWPHIVYQSLSDIPAFLWV